MLADPAFLARCQLQFLVGEQQIAAGVPAFGNADALIDGDRLERFVDDLQQLRVIPAHREAETIGFMFAEVGHLHVVQIALVDQVMGRNGVAEKHIGLVEGHGIDRALKRRVGLKGRVGVQRLDFVQRQVVIDHAQAHAGQAVSERTALSDSGDQHRLVHGIRQGQGQVVTCRLETIGAAKQIDVSFAQGFNGRGTGLEAQHLDRCIQRMGENTGVIGGEAFIVVAGQGHVERRVVRSGGAEPQLALVLQPLPLAPVEPGFHVTGAGPAEQGVILRCKFSRLHINAQRKSCDQLQIIH